MPILVIIVIVLVGVCGRVPQVVLQQVVLVVVERDVKVDVIRHASIPVEEGVEE